MKPCNSLSVWANQIGPSLTLIIDAKAKALKAAGHSVCGFGAGEPDCDTPDFIKEACIQAIKDGKTKYVPAAGLPELREAIAHKYTHENRIVGGVQAGQVMVSPGGKFSCYLALLATCSPGDEVIIPAPYWVSYPEMVRLTGATPVYVFAGQESDFKITPEMLRAAITPRTRLLILNSPSNPTGAVYTQAELEALMQVVVQAGIYLLSDEIYEYLVYDGCTHVSPVSLSQEAAACTLTMSGFSKTFSMTGWRLGTLVTPPHLAKAVDNLQSHICSNATTFAQYGALEAMRNKAAFQAFLGGMLKVFDQRRMRLFRALEAIPGIECSLSQGAFYLMPKIDAFGKTSVQFCEALLEAQQVALVPGIAFGAEDYVRFSYATSDAVIDAGVERLAAFCKGL